MAGKGTCFSCRFEWLRLILFVAAVIVGSLLLPITYISALAGQPVFSKLFLILLATAAFLFFSSRLLNRFLEKKCTKSGCRDSCHTTFGCQRAHHHWCDPDRDYSLMEVGVAGEVAEIEDDYCESCAWQHQEDRFQLAVYDRKEYACWCACHQPRTMQKKWRCTCHRWCR